jgi:hypothetical protein
VNSPKRLARINVAVEGKANRGSLATNHYLDMSADGEAWSHLASTENLEVNKSGWAGHGLTADIADDPAFASVNTFYVRLRLDAGNYQERHPYLSGIVENVRIEAVAK